MRGSTDKSSYTLFPISDKERLLKGLGQLKSASTEPDYQGVTSLTAAQNRREIELIYKALQSARGNISQAAKQLGVSRQLLHYKLKKYGIETKEFKK
jgi:arginine utilization regulatory protein